MNSEAKNTDAIGLNMESLIKPDTLAELQAENLRLIALLEAHGIDWCIASEPPLTTSVVLLKPESSTLTTSEKVELFRRLFRGRSDVYPIRWESKTTGKSGYVPACANEWRAGICHKPKIKCSDCGVRELSPLSDTVIYNHLQTPRSLHQAALKR